MKNLTIALSLCFFCNFQTKVQAWSEGGHRVIALIAYEKLTPNQRSHFTKILRQHPRYHEDFETLMPAQIVQSSESDKQRWLFTQAAVWPDMVRSFTEPILSHYHHATWHYINMPVFLDELSTLQLKSKIKTNQQIEWSEGSDPTWNNAAQSIDMAKKHLLSPKTGDPDKALMLCWLLHLIGDIHQPLHCVSLFSLYQFPNLKSGDTGGNDILVSTKNPLKPQSLHSIWDGLLGYNGSMNDLRARTSRLLQDETKQREIEKSLEVTSISQWIEEGRACAALYAYPPELREKLLTMRADHIMPITLSENYLRQAGDIAQLRANIAGQRLAKMLGIIAK